MYKHILILALLGLAACDTTPATDAANLVAVRKMIAEDFPQLKCPAELPVVIKGAAKRNGWEPRDAQAYRPGSRHPGGSFYMPGRYAESAGPKAHSRVAHEIAHICGADKDHRDGLAHAVAKHWSGF